MRPPCPICRTEMELIDSDPQPWDGVAWNTYRCPKAGRDAQHPDPSASIELQHQMTSLELAAARRSS